MSTKSSSKKLKKPLDLPLGKSPSQKEIDLSHVRLPIDTSIFGLKQVLTLFETATFEVKNYLAYECDLMYECRICRTIFRSLANFILHKRKYCREKYSPLEDPFQKCHQTDEVSIIQKDIEDANKILLENTDSDKKKHNRHLNPIIEALLKKQEQTKFIEDLKNEDLTDASKTETNRKGKYLDNILLEKIDSSEAAVFQTASHESDLKNAEFMKSEVMEIHSIIDDNEAIIGADGKVLKRGSSNIKQEKKSCKYTISCTECDLKFSTKKTLAYHVKYKHNNTRLVYPCPECKDLLANAWSVYRHLLKVHRKTSTQIRKYRSQIHNSAICKKVKDLHPRLRKDNKETKEENDEENEWLDNVEGDNDLQMCGGCGKRFERKAALLSHSVMCTKRIAICNSIKENNAKKKEADDRENKQKIKTAKLNKPPLIGSAKRKPECLITYKPKTDDSQIETNTLKDEEQNSNSKNMIENVEVSERQLDEVITITSEEDDDTNEIENDMTEQFDRESVMSIIGVDINNSECNSPSKDSEENFCSKLSDGSGSPCRGFENSQTIKFPELSRILPFEDFSKNSTDNCENIHESDVVSQEVDSTTAVTCENTLMDETPVETVKDNLMDNLLTCNEIFPNDFEVSVSLNTTDSQSETIVVDEETQEIRSDVLKTGDTHEPKETDSSPIDNENERILVQEFPDKTNQKELTHSGISLNNNVSEESYCENYDMVLSNDRCSNSENSIKSLIKDIINEKQDHTYIQPFLEEKKEETTRENPIEYTVITVVPEEIITVKNNSEFSVSREESLKTQDNESLKSVNKELEEEVVNADHDQRNFYVKRKRTLSSQDEWKSKKSVKVRSESDEALTENEDEIFLSRITPYTDMPNLTCSLCNSTFNSLSHLLLHMSIHFSWYRYQCSKCSFMSYNKYDCESHVHKEHKLPFNKMQNTVLPIPTWKTASISNKVIILEPLQCEDPKLENNDSPDQNTTSIEDENVNTDEFEPIHYDLTDSNQESGQKEVIIDLIDLTEEIDDLEGNIVDNNEDNSTSISEKNCEISDLSKTAILEVILGNDCKKRKEKNKDATVAPVEYMRPPRNRIKSVKTSQKDFIYDLNIVKNKPLKGNN
ncbi:hypothetical protein HHI36_012124 [Cryptolaemus montrouzieri]|uniref:C2H2-type domain-containing protein n=1 Tax=Cryptolaemus montrouzieri TaxID=559131 RepID=A0ABD2NEA9_9CUCU